MIVEIDGKKIEVSPLENVKVILDQGHYKRHINVTYEGIIVDIVQDSEVLDTYQILHDDLVEGPEPL